jgi:hydrogenase maturation protein HypF
VQVLGQVQGVGFRPFVYRLAHDIGLSGWVRNCGTGVEIEVQGSGANVEAILQRIRLESPPLARITEVTVHSTATEPEHGFAILQSRSGESATRIAPDTAVCSDCLAELFGPANRRHRYAFVNCTHCGPRYTIAASLPYDRANTSMAGFEPCVACLAEYHRPEDRRFHAEGNACPACGPRVALLDADGRNIATQDEIASAVAMLLAGQVLAVKGLGGFHMICDASNPEAIARLRCRKAREEKPFAVMVLNAESAQGLANCTREELALLECAERPIVLVERARRLAGVADEMPKLGIMLPYTPLHYLLFHEAAGRPAGIGWLSMPLDFVIVCTSANPGGEPLVRRNDEALLRLQGIADGFLVHDRDILVCADDSVLRLLGKVPAFVRRGRGFAPSAIELGLDAPAVLAVGGHFKNTICATRGREAFVSQHIGDLDSVASCEALEQAVEHLSAILGIAPELVVHDLHPDFFSSHFAAQFAHKHGIEVLAVQHHHAHIAAVAAEHRLAGPVLGLALDGMGLGTDGSQWGGELLSVRGSDMQRIGALRPLALPGGDRAAREPWRVAAAALHALGRVEEIPSRFRQPGAAMVVKMLEQGVNAPPTSSCGRLFDAAAGLLGVKQISSFEGQAAMLLEGLASRHGPARPLEDAFILEDGQLSFLPLLDRLADIHQVAYGAALFHATLVAGLAAWVTRTARRLELNTVVLGGGCFLNEILCSGLAGALRSAGLQVAQARLVPPNDGGLALGQAWIGMHHLRR